MSGNGVTVYCLAYNHEKYIEKTLQGFVMQRTNFPFKVIVHDDASTDKTASIIRKYVDKYPTLIYPIFQTENQYSKGIEIYKTFIEPIIETDLVAVCEGDDYWTDKKKIQSQYDYMISHPSCSLCVHSTMYITEAGVDTGEKSNYLIVDKDYDANDVISVGGGGLFHTSSFCYRKRIRDILPDWMQMNGFGDYSLAMYCSMNGYVHYIGNVMSAYRLSSVGSWSQRNKEKQSEIDKQIINSLLLINDKTNYIYKESIEKAITKYQFKICVQNRELNKIFTNKNIRLYFNSLPLRMRLSVIKQCIMHWL